MPDRLGLLRLACLRPYPAQTLLPRRGRMSQPSVVSRIYSLPTPRDAAPLLLGAFRFFQGTPKELVHDNMLTAVIAHPGPVVRFNEQFLEFLRPFHIAPIACNVKQPQEKGKVKKGPIHYIRHNFWPLRSFTNLDDLHAQANHWRDQVANRRVHRTTRWRPLERFRS